MSIEIILTSDGSQKFSTTIEGTSYNFEVSYNTRLNLWTCDISSGGVNMVRGIGLLGGIDIVNQFVFPLKYTFVVNLDNSTEDAGPDNLGTVVKLFKLTEDEVLSFD